MTAKRVLGGVRRTYSRMDAWAQRHWILIVALIVGIVLAWLF
jgi:hypothetical protein